MFKIKCRCGKSEMTFKKNIGDFYIDTCCQIAGYDHLGNLKKGSKKNSKVEDQPQEIQPLADSSKNSKIEELVSISEVEVLLKTDGKPEERAKRPYNKSGNIKIES